MDTMLRFTRNSFRTYLARNVFVIATIKLLMIFILLTPYEYVEITYYSDSDAFGSLSQYPHIILSEIMIPVIIMLLIIEFRIKNLFLYLAPSILLIFIKFIVADIMDRYYVTHFYDAPGHLVRGLYVTFSGHSNPRVDRYFDLQPAFFWVTAILLNVIGAIPKSYVDYISIFLVKWFHIIAIILYIPILYTLYKHLLKNNLLASIAMFLHFGIEFTRFHYAAQTWGNALYWLIILIILQLINSNNIKYLMLSLLVGISIVFVHQGVAIASILTLAAITLFAFLNSNTAEKRGRFVTISTVLLVIVFASWIARLMYMAIPTFHDFINRLQYVIERVFKEGTEVVPKGISRADTTWSFVVFLKSIYLGTLILLPLTLLSYSAFKRRKKKRKDMLLFTIHLFMTLGFGGIAVYLGGAGFIERLPRLILPIITYSVVKNVIFQLLTYKRNNSSMIAISTILVLLVLIGTVFYMSGRNFQSVPYGAYYSKYFIVINDPQSSLELYPKLRIESIRNVVEKKIVNATLDRVKQPMIVSVLRQDVIQTQYYVYEDKKYIISIVKDLMRKHSLIYQNPDALLYFCTSGRS